MARTEKQVNLTTEMRKELEQFTTTGVRSVKLLKRARIILALDISTGIKPENEEKIAKRTEVSRQTIQNVKKDFFASANISSFLQRKKRETPPVSAKMTGELEAHIIALACSEAPEGFSKWSLRLLADKCIELDYIDKISHMTVSRVLKKHNLSLT
jgi:transposase